MSNIHYTLIYILHTQTVTVNNYLGVPLDQQLLVDIQSKCHTQKLSWKTEMIDDDNQWCKNKEYLLAIFSVIQAKKIFPLRQ